MASKSLFRSLAGVLLREADAKNHEGAIAYRQDAAQALAQLAATGCFGHTFYAEAEEQLDKTLELCDQVSPLFLAKLAIYARERGFLKDMPALLCARLAATDGELLKVVFPRVIDNGRMLRNFVQIVRSGVVGRKSLGTRPKKLVQQWLADRGEAALFRDSVGNDPSLADVIKMVHPHPSDDTRRALYAYLVGMPCDVAKLPESVRRYEAFKADPTGPTPDVEFRLLTSLPLGREQWSAIARAASWHMTRMNLNTFVRHGVFEDEEVVRLVAERLGSPEAVRRARVFPYQLLAAYLNAGADVPRRITEALQDAMEVATENVPEVEGRVFVCPDVSGSMRAPATGYRQGAASKVRCVDVAALVSAALLRKNPSAGVLPFEQDVVDVHLNPRDTIMTNAGRLASIGGGGTNCSAPLRELNRRRAKGDLVVFVSDNESWVDDRRRGATATVQEWERFRTRNPRARLVCIDVTPNVTTQAFEREDVLNVGGFSDHVFSLVASFAKGEMDDGHWVAEIEKISVEGAEARVA